MIINHRTYDGLARRGCSLKVGGDSVGIEVGAGNVIRVVSNAGAILADNHDLPGDFAVQSISAELASGQLHPVLYVFGFTPGRADQERYVILMDNFTGPAPIY